MYTFSPSTIIKSSEINGNFVEATGIIGEGKLWFTNTPPANYLLCDGSAISRTTYAALYAVIGTTYGVGNNSTTFNLPPNGYVPVGYKAGDATFGTLGAKVGAKTHTLTTAETPPHIHTVPTWLNVGGGGTDDRAYTPAGGGSDTTDTSSIGSGTAHNNIQPSFVCNFIIKYQ